MIKTVQIPVVEEFLVVEVFTDQGLQLPAAGMDALEILGEGGRKAFLEEHLAVAQYVINRRAEFVADAGQIHARRGGNDSVRRRALAHEAGRRDNWASIFSRSRASSIGLVS